MVFHQVFHTNPPVSSLFVLSDELLCGTKLSNLHSANFDHRSTKTLETKGARALSQKMPKVTRALPVHIERTRNIWKTSKHEIDEIYEMWKMWSVKLRVQNVMLLISCQIRLQETFPS